MKIAIIQTPLVDQTGGERQSLELAVNLRRKGHDVTIFTPYFDKGKCYPELNKNINIVVLNKNLAILEKGISKNKILNFLYIFRHYKNFIVMRQLGLLIDDSFDIINPHNMPTHWAAFFAAKRVNKPIVWMCNEPPFWYLEKNNFLKKIINFPLFPIFDMFVVRHIQKIIVLDKLNSIRVKNIYKKNMDIVYSGLDIDKFKILNDKEKLKQKYGLKNKFVLLLISTLASYKRPGLGIKAFIKFASKHRNTHLILIGKGELENQIRGLVKKERLENSFSLFKDLTENKLLEMYQMSDVFLFPAVQTWGLVVIEAMINNLPVLVEKGSGVAEIIEDNDNGYRVNFEDIEEVVKILDLLFNNKYLRQNMGSNARNFVINNFSWNKYTIKMINIFLGVLNK